MKLKKASPRVPISTAVNQDWHDRITKLRKNGWKITDIIKAGVEAAEKS